jgi:hypothetical protein
MIYIGRPMLKNKEALKAWAFDKRVLCQICGGAIEGNYWEDLTAATEWGHGLISRRDYVERALDNPHVVIVCKSCLDKLPDVDFASDVFNADGVTIILEDAVPEATN